jgi:hypothetical protein
MAIALTSAREQLRARTPRIELRNAQPREEGMDGLSSA